MSTQTYVDGVTLTAATEFNRFDTAAYPSFSGVAGTNTITATGPANYSYSSTNPLFVLIPVATNTGATTINVTPTGSSALGAKNVFANGAACVGGELVAGVPAAVAYDGTQFNVVGLGRAAGTHQTSFSWNGSGNSTGVLDLNWQRIGQWVKLDIPALSATTGTGSTLLTNNTALPAGIRPASTHVAPVNNIKNNNAAIASAGALSVTSSGVLNLVRDGASAAFTDGAAAGTAFATSITYFTG